MANEAIKSLTMKIVADIGNFTSGLNRAETALKNFAGKAASLAGGALASFSIANFARQVVEQGQRLNDLSESLGIAANKLSGYEYAAGQANVPTEELTSGLRKLGVSLQDAIANPASAAAQAFQRLGISQDFLRDNANSLDVVFEKVAGRYGQFADGAGKVAISNDLLGRSSLNLIRMMNSLADSTKAAQDAGALFPEKFTALVSTFDRELKRIEASMAGMLAQSQGFENFLTSVQFVLKSVASIAISVWTALENIGLALGSLGAAAVQAAKFNFAEARKIIELSSADMAENEEKANARLKAIWAEPVIPSAGKTNKNTIPLPDMGKVSADYISLIAAMKKTLDESNLSLITDEREKALLRVGLVRDEWTAKIEIAKSQGKIYQQEYASLLDWLDLTTAAMQKAALFATRSPIEKLAEQWQQVTDRMKEATARWTDDLAQRLTDFVMTGKFNFKDFANSVIQDMVRIRIQSVLSGILSGGGSSMLDAFASFFGGAHAGGGIAQAGKISLVGENGPELILPATNSRVIPNSALGGNIKVMVENHGTPIQAREAQMTVDMEGAVVKIITDDIRQGGPLSGNLARAFNLRRTG